MQTLGFVFTMTAAEKEAGSCLASAEIFQADWIFVTLVGRAVSTTGRHNFGTGRQAISFNRKAQ